MPAPMTDQSASRSPAFSTDRPARNHHVPLELLEPRLLLSANPLLGSEVISASASQAEVIAGAVGSDIIFQEQTQNNNFFSPNVLTFDFAIDPEASNGRIDLTALSDLDSLSETVTFDAEGIVTTELFTTPDDGIRPFSATINFNDTDLATLAADGILHISFTPSADVDDFSEVQEYLTVGLTYETAPTPITLAPALPVSSGVYAAWVPGQFTHSADVDVYTVDLEAGQALRIEGVPDAGARMAVEISDPNGNVIFAGSTLSSSSPVLHQAVPVTSDGTYTIKVSANGVPGLYALNVFVNELIEVESLGGAANDSLATAQDLDPGFMDDGEGVQRVVLRGASSFYIAQGHPDGGRQYIESFESGVLGPLWTTNSSGTVAYSRINVSTDGGAADGIYALLMDTSSTASGPVLNEAIWSVDLSGYVDVTLSFSQAEWADESNSLPTSFTGSYNGDGVAISTGGVIGPTWRTLLSAPNSSSGVWNYYSYDLAAAAAAAGMPLGTNFKIKFQQYDDDPRPSDGRGYDNIILTASNTNKTLSVLPDFYKFSLNAGEFASIQLADPEGEPVSYKLFDAAGNQLTPANIVVSGGAAVLSDFKAPATGDYYISVTYGSGDYLLTVARGTTIESNPNDGLLQAQQLGRTGSVLGSLIGLGDTDAYKVSVAQGDQLVFQTRTPDDGVSGLNTTDPTLTLYDPTGAVIISNNNGAGDGRNALLTHTATLDGEYRITVTGTGPGVYVLKADGYSDTEMPLAINSWNITDGALLDTPPTLFELQFADPVLPTSVQDGHLIINGHAATVALITNSNRTVRYSLPSGSVVEGLNTIRFLAGSARNLQGDTNETITTHFTLDTSAPTIIASSLLEGDVVPAGDTTIVLKFSEPVMSNVLATGGHTSLNSTSNEDAVSYDPLTNELSVTYNGLTEGEYTFTLNYRSSGSLSYYIQDAAGNTLDGEANATSTVPSGNGIDGGDFIVHFSVSDNTPVPLPLTATPISHAAAAFAYRGDFTGTPDYVGDEDRYTLELKPGQILSLDVDNYSGILETELELLDPSGASIATSTDGGPLLHEVRFDQGGTYTLIVRVTSLTLGSGLSYTGHVTINAVTEAESAGGPTNDDLASAQDLNPAFFSLGDGVEQAVVLEQTAGNPGTLSESFETGSLGSAWTTSSTSGGRIQVTSAYGAADGSYALLMDNPSGTSRNEAIWTVDLSGYSEAELSFAYAEWGDEDTSLPSSYSGSVNGDGVSISDDGVNWYTILNSPSSSTSWTNFTIDLVARATAAGMSLGPNFKIKFQQYDTNPLTTDGRGYDNISITGNIPIPPTVDVYKITLGAGETLGVALYGQADPNDLHLLGADGKVITFGQDAWLDAAASIAGFAAPEAGDYFVRINNTPGAYTLITTRGASYSPEPTSSSNKPAMGPDGTVVAALDSFTDTDSYTFEANAGDNLVLWTTTPGYDPLGPENLLNTYLELTGPDGLLKAEGGSGGDGLNALLSHTAATSGTYTVKVRHEVQLGGANFAQGYVLHTAGGTVGTTPLSVVSASLAQNQVLTSPPQFLTMNFSTPIDFGSITPGALTVNGTPSTWWANIDADTVKFFLPTDLGDGMYNIEMAQGAIRGIDGRPIDAFSRQVSVDTTAPRVVSTSIQQGDTLEPGEVVLSIVFDEPLYEGVLSASDVTIYGGTDDTAIIGSLFEYDPVTSTLTIGFSATQEGLYFVRLASSASGFRDAAGNPLDGEAPAGTLPPEVSGNGTPGGDFILSFNVDKVAPAELATPDRLSPLGLLAAVSSPNTGMINSADDTDTFRVFAQTGQFLTAVLTQDGGELSFTTPAGVATNSSPDSDIVVTYQHVGPAGYIDLIIAGDELTKYELLVYLNATLESRLPVLPGDGETAVELGGAFVGLGDGSTSVATVIGQGQPVRSITHDDIFAPGTHTFDFTNMTPPTGDGTLTITVRGDFGDIDEYLSLNGENLIVTDLFVDDGLENLVATTTVNLPQADLETMAANGSIRFTVTPSGTVDNYGDSFLTLELSYPGMPAPPDDTYAVELAEGQTISAVIGSDSGDFTAELIDVATGLAVASSAATPGYGHAIIDFVAPNMGRYDLVITTPNVETYTLTVLRGATPDIEPNQPPALSLPSLDATGRAAGLLQSPGPERLFASSYSRSSSNGIQIFELDPVTFQELDTFYIKGPYYADAIAFDGVHLYAQYIEPTGIWVFDPDTGQTIRKIEPTTNSSAYGIATYGGMLVQQDQQGLIYIDPYSGSIVDQVPLSIPYGFSTALTGAEPRGSIFLASYTPGTDNSRTIYEVDAQTGEILNTISNLSPGIRSLAFVDGKLYAYDQYQYTTIQVYDPDTSQLIDTYTITKRSFYRAIGGDGLVPRSDQDQYTLTLGAGEQVALSTATPYDHPDATLLNSLDPALRVLDPNGVEIAFNNSSATDGKNASLSFTATVAGVYTVEVLSESGTGEYLLTAERLPGLTGDLDADGFVGIADLNIVLGAWNQNVTAGNWLQGDPSGDGYVGIQDLNAVLGNWNAASPETPPMATPTAARASAQMSSAQSETSIPSSEVSETIPQVTQRSHGYRLNDSPPKEPAVDTHNRAALAAWSYPGRRQADRNTSHGYVPWSLRQQEEPAVLGLWEDAGPNQH